MSAATILSPKTIGLGAAALLGTGAIGAGLYLHRNSERSIISAEVYDPHCLVQRLYEIKDDAETLGMLQRELENEWGPFAPANPNEMYAMAENAGKMIYVMRQFEDRVPGAPIGILQTGLADVHGDYKKLVGKYPAFNAVTSNGTWEESMRMGGDTALLLQITAFGERSRGVGSLLRDTVLYMLPRNVRHALTLSPIDGTGYVDLQNPETYTPTMRFHIGGGAKPAGYARDYKVPDPARPNIDKENKHGHDVVFMKYSRDEAGEWAGLRRPGMSLTFDEPSYKQLLSHLRDFSPLRNFPKHTFPFQHDSSTST